MSTTFYVPVSTTQGADPAPAAQPRRATTPLRPTMMYSQAGMPAASTASSVLGGIADGTTRPRMGQPRLHDPRPLATHPATRAQTAKTDDTSPSHPVIRAAENSSKAGVAHGDPARQGARRIWPAARSILLFLLFFAAWILLLAVAGSPTDALVSATHATPAGARLIYEVVPLLTVVIPTVVLGLVFRRYAGIPTLSRARREGIDTAVGIGLGVVLFAASAGVLWALGSLSVSGVATWDGSLPIWVLALTLNAAFQEYLVHGWGFDVLDRGCGPVAATIITTVVFTLLHPGAFEVGPLAVACIAAFGVLIALLRLVSGGLLAPTLIHAVWNVLGGIGLGLVTLADDYPHVLNGALSGSPLLASGMGLESSLTTLVILLATSAVLLVLYLRRRPATR